MRWLLSAMSVTEEEAPWCSAEACLPWRWMKGFHMILVGVWVDYRVLGIRSETIRKPFQ